MKRKSRVSTSRSNRRPRLRATSSTERRWPVNLDDFEEIARRRLDPMEYAYVAGAAADEITLRRNRDAFAALRLKPRVLVDVSHVDMRVHLFGETLDYPILLAPTAYHKLSHPDGELATARGASAAGATMIVSSGSSVPIEHIAAAASRPLWFQLYVSPDRAFARDLVARVQAAGCRALVLTVDSPVFGVRNREARARFELPAGIQSVHLRPPSAGARQTGHVAVGGVYSTMTDPALTWKDVDWLCSTTKCPVLLKGILSPEDALLAVEHGAAGIIVSNHGGRNLDTAPATIEALPRIAQQIRGRIPILLDGGIRRGTDVLKALALGAQAVLIGRPYVWGLAAGGAEGVAEVIRILRNEFHAAMALCGLPEIARIDADVLWRD